jgi:hypothetical protein
MKLNERNNMGNKRFNIKKRFNKYTQANKQITNKKPTHTKQETDMFKKRTLAQTTTA